MTVAKRPDGGQRSRARLGWVLRVAVSAATLAIIFHFVRIEDVWREARRLPPAIWVAGLIAFLIGHAASAAKWRLLIGTGASYAQALRAHLAGLAANLCLPGIAGGDVVRAGLIFRQMKDPARLAAGSVADRLLDTCSLGILAVVGGLIAFGARTARGSELLVVTVLALIGIGLALGLTVGAAHWLRARPMNTRIGKLVGTVARAICDLVREPGRLAACLALSLGIQTLFVCINVMFANSAQVKAPVAAWFFAWASAKIIAIAPISLGGLGVREASTAGLLAPFGAEPARVIAVGLIWQTVLYVSGLIGLLGQAVWKPAAGPRERSSPSMSAEASS